MPRPLFERLFVVFAAAAALFCARTTAQSPSEPELPPVLARFLARHDPPPAEYRVLRHLDARNDHFGLRAWMDAWVDCDPAAGFRYQIVGEGGSRYIRSRVLRTALEGEKKMWTAGEPQRAGLTSNNYEFQEGAAAAEELATLVVKPRRKDVLLVDGSLFVRPDDGDLVRIEGRLSKAPSFWTRRVEIVRRYARIAGVRVPVAIESVASVFIAGRSTFQMTYEYETINGEHVGSPQPRVMAEPVKTR